MRIKERYREREQTITQAHDMDEMTPTDTFLSRAV